MKSYKKKEKSLYSLLIKHYVFFALVLLIVTQIFSYVENKAENAISHKPRVNQPIGGQELLAEENYTELSLKTLLGAEGYFEIYDADARQLYTENKGQLSTYSEREISLIPQYNTEIRYEMRTYETEDEKERVLITAMKRAEDTGYQQDLWYVLLDENRNVMESSTDFPYTSLSQKELKLFTLSPESGSTVYRYTFQTNAGAERTLLMHVTDMDGRRYRRLNLLDKLYFPIYALVVLAAALIFTLWIHKRVKEPLLLLKSGIQDFADGRRDTKLSYTGPKEFEDIFDSFNRMATQLQQSEQMQEHLLAEKQRMLADISHDLKTPITVIQGYAKAVSDGLTDEETQQQYLKTITQKAENLTEMINTFYDYSKLEHPEFNLVKEKLDLAEFLREYLAEKYDEIELGGFAIEAEIPEEVVEYSFDKVQMKRVFDNVLSNSLRHNPPGTVIYVTLQQTEKSIRIELGDNGVGIPEEIRGRLFDPFTVGDESRNTKQGSGLGLAVAHKIVELHGGALFLETTAEEKPYVQTLFVIRLLK